MNDQTRGEKLRRRYSEFKRTKARVGSPLTLLPSQAQDRRMRLGLTHHPTRLEHFEISHPILTLLIKQVLDTLNQMGI